MGRLERVSIIGIFEALAHRVAIWLEPQLADAARGELDSSRSAKFVHVLLRGAETTGRNRNFNLVRIFPHLKLYTLNRGGFACLILWRERRGIGRLLWNATAAVQDLARHGSAGRYLRIECTTCASRRSSLLVIELPRRGRPGAWGTPGPRKTQPNPEAYRRGETREISAIRQEAAVCLAVDDCTVLGETSYESA